MPGIADYFGVISQLDGPLEINREALMAEFAAQFGALDPALFETVTRSTPFAPPKPSLLEECAAWCSFKAAAADGCHPIWHPRGSWISKSEILPTGAKTDHFDVITSRRMKFSKLEDRLRLLADFRPTYRREHIVTLPGIGLTRDDQGRGVYAAARLFL